MFAGSWFPQTENQSEEIAERFEQVDGVQLAQAVRELYGMEGVQRCLAELTADDEPRDQDMDGLFAELISEDDPNGLFAQVTARDDMSTQDMVGLFKVMAELDNGQV